MTTDRPAPISGAPATRPRKEAPVADDLMQGYRRIVTLAPRAGAAMAGVPDQRCVRARCHEPAAWRVERKALCDRHARERVTKIKNGDKK